MFLNYALGINWFERIYSYPSCFFFHSCFQNYFVLGINILGNLLLELRHTGLQQNRKCNKISENVY